MRKESTQRTQEKELTKRTLLFTRTVLQILFRISQSNGEKEIHEIRIWIS